MPEEGIDAEVTESSTVETQDVTPAESSPAEPAKDAQVAESSPAEGEKEPDFVGIVDKALGTEEPPASGDDGGEAGSKEPEAQKVEAEDGLPDDPTEDELKDAAPRTRRRIEHLLDQRKGLREAVDALKPAAEQWATIDSYRQQQNLKPEYVANAIQIAALIENEPAKAFQVVERLHGMLAQKVGVSLPENLRDAVKTGEITREHAFELSQAKAQASVLQEQRALDTQRREQSDRSNALTEQTRVAADTSTAWDKAKSTSDPDWQLKRQEVANRVELRLRSEGIPETSESMLKVLEEEAKAVESFAGQFRSVGRALKPTPDSASPRGAAPRVPKDHFDVVDMALGG